MLLTPRTARMLITFGGDGGNLVLGTLLMMTIYASRESALRRGWLHWGYRSSAPRPSRIPSTSGGAPGRTSR
ncbi:hypothetical protein ACN28S_41045 [Cystobacter fuscus]